MSGDVQVVDLRGEPHQLEPHEWTRHVVRDPAELRGVVLHAWAAKDVGTMLQERRRHGEPLALARRGLRVPYTISCGVTALGGVPVVSIAHPVERYTMASDAANSHCLSIGVMGRFAFEAEQHNSVRHTEMTAALEAAIAAALDVAADLLGRGRGPHQLLTHRQCANGTKDHFACPGEAVVAAALRSRAVRDGLLVADPDHVILPKFGKPWPEAWRRHLRKESPPQPQSKAENTREIRSLESPSAD